MARPSRSMRDVPILCPVDYARMYITVTRSSPLSLSTYCKLPEHYRASRPQDFSVPVTRSFFRSSPEILCACERGHIGACAKSLRRLHPCF